MRPVNLYVLGAVLAGLAILQGGWAGWHWALFGMDERVGAAHAYTFTFLVVGAIVAFAAASMIEDDDDEYEA